MGEFKNYPRNFENTGSMSNTAALIPIVEIKVGLCMIQQ